MLHITYFIILHHTSTSQLSFSSALAQLCSASPKLVKPVQLCVKTGDSLLPSLSGARLICRLTGLTSPAMCRSINCFWAGASLTYHRCWSPKVRNIFPQHTHTHTLGSSQNCINCCNINHIKSRSAHFQNQRYKSSSAPHGTVWTKANRDKRW